MSTDFEAEAEKDADPEIARVYEWNGKTLLPFSVGRHTALQRLKVIMGSEMESASCLVRLCQMPAEEVVRIRGEACNDFLVSLEGWMEKEGIGLGSARKTKTDALLALYAKILGDLYDAESIVPEDTGKPGGNG